MACILHSEITTAPVDAESIPPKDALRAWQAGSRGEPCPKCGGEMQYRANGTKAGKIRRFKLACASCEAGRLRDLRANNPGWSTNKNKAWQVANPEKRRAHKKVECALLSGKLVRQPCERCGTTVPVHAHHDDYSKPLEVMWLCQTHHKERHRELDAAVTTEAA